MNRFNKVSGITDFSKDVKMFLQQMFAPISHNKQFILEVLYYLSNDVW